MDAFDVIGLSENQHYCNKCQQTHYNDDPCPYTKVNEAFDKFMPWAEFDGPKALWLGMLEVFKAGWEAHEKIEPILSKDKK